MDEIELRVIKSVLPLYCLREGDSFAVRFQLEPAIFLVEVQMVETSINTLGEDGHRSIRPPLEQGDQVHILISDLLLSGVIDEDLGEDSRSRVEESASELMSQETCIVISHNSNEGSDMV